MTIEYVILDISWQSLLQKLSEREEFAITETEKGVIRIAIDLGRKGDKYSLHKRVALSKVIGIPPDDVQQGTNEAQIFLNQTEDTENTWLSGSAVSITHPELVLDAIVEALGEHSWYSEYDDMFKILAGWEEE